MRKFLLGFLLLLSACSQVPPPAPPAPPAMVERIAPAKINCVDTLGAAKFPAELKAIPLNIGISAFAKTFGDAFPIIKRELERGRSHVRINLLWSDSHSYGDSDIPFIKSEARRYEPLCAKYPEKVELAPFTEHNLPNPDKYLAIVMQAAPSCGTVNSVWRGSFTRNPDYTNEVHGAHSPPSIPGVEYNYSYDGLSSVDSDIEAMRIRHSRAKMFCVWHPRLNGKWSMSDSTPRPQRKGWPSQDLLRSLVYLFTEKGLVSIPSNWVVKSHADNHGPNDPKGDKLLVISPIRAAQIVLKRAGVKVGSLTYYDKFDGGGFRYYAKVMGFKLGAALDMFIGNKVYGTINGGFRGPPFREK